LRDEKGAGNLAKMVAEQRQPSFMSVIQLLSSLSLEVKIGIVVAAAAVVAISKLALGKSSAPARGMHMLVCGVVAI
jgi:hypothetical protein